MRSRSCATYQIVFSPSRTHRNAPTLNSGVNRRRVRLPAGLVCILDIIFTFQIVSTKAGEAHRATFLQSGEDVRIGASEVFRCFLDALELVTLHGEGNPRGGAGVTRAWFKSQCLFRRRAFLESIIDGIA